MKLEPISHFSARTTLTSWPVVRLYHLNDIACRRLLLPVALCSETDDGGNLDIFIDIAWSGLSPDTVK
jgi:hypothetical protein